MLSICDVYLIGADARARFGEICGRFLSARAIDVEQRDGVPGCYQTLNHCESDARCRSGYHCHALCHVTHLLYGLTGCTPRGANTGVQAAAIEVRESDRRLHRLDE